MTKHKDLKNEEHILNLIKNYNLLRIVEKIEARKTVTSHQSLNDSKMDKSLNDSKLNSSMMNKSIKGSEAVDLSVLENSILHDPLCKKHMLPVNYYAIGTNLLVCEKCLIEKKNLKAHPLPSVNL